MDCKTCGEEILHNQRRCLEAQTRQKPRPPWCSVCGNPATVRALVQQNADSRITEDMLCKMCVEAMEEAGWGVATEKLTEDDWV